MKKIICCLLAFLFLAACTNNPAGQSSADESSDSSSNSSSSSSLVISSSVPEAENWQNGLVVDSSVSINCYQLPGPEEESSIHIGIPQFLKDNSILLTFDDTGETQERQYEYLLVSADGQQVLYHETSEGFALPQNYPGQLPTFIRDSNKLYIFHSADKSTEITLEHTPIESVSLSPDAKKILYGSEGSCFLYDVEAGAETALQIENGAQNIAAADFLSDKYLRVLLQEGQTETEAVLDLESNEIVATSDLMSGGYIVFPGKNHIVFGRSGINGSDMPSAVICDATVEPPVYKELGAKPEMVFFSQNGEWLGLSFLEEDGNRVAIYDTATLTLQWEFVLDKDKTAARDLDNCKALSDDGTSVVLANGVDNSYLIQKAE